MLEAQKAELARLHQELPRHNLVVWTGGNVSVRDPETGLVAIKPSGVLYEDLTADKTTYPKLLGLDESRRRADGLISAAAAALEPWRERAAPLLALAAYITARDR